jgi:hypothetical protein
MTADKEVQPHLVWEEALQLNGTVVDVSGTPFSATEFHFRKCHNRAGKALTSQRQRIRKEVSTLHQ